MAKAEIPCKPIFKVIEDGLVVGVLTETNQFIQLSEPILENEIEIKNEMGHKVESVKLNGIRYYPYKEDKASTK